VVVGCKTDPTIHLSQSISRYRVSVCWDLDEVKTLIGKVPIAHLNISSGSQPEVTYKVGLMKRSHAKGPRAPVLIAGEAQQSLETPGLTHRNRGRRLETFMGVRPCPNPKEGIY
jgi:hypothetical protein